MLRMARYLYEGGTITARWIADKFGVSHATAERDMRIVMCYLPVEHLPAAPVRHARGGALTRHRLVIDGAATNWGRL